MIFITARTKFNELRNWKCSITRREETLLVELWEDNHFAKKIMFSDQAHFHFNGFLSKQNCSIWGSENPHFSKERIMYLQRVRGFRQAVSSALIYKLLFFFLKIRQDQLWQSLVYYNALWKEKEKEKRIFVSFHRCNVRWAVTISATKPRPTHSTIQQRCFISLRRDQQSQPDCFN